tara:strand:- start:282 stop:818 length:537 start_codon:yes stop_codon:yes gene_type:complete
MSRTTIKFYENLSNSHVSNEKKVERLELKDIKTLDKYLSEAKSMRAEVKAAREKYIESFLEEAKLANIKKQADIMAEVAHDNIEAYKKEVDSEFAKLNKLADKKQGIYLKAKDKWLKEEANMHRLEEIEEIAVNDAKILAGQFEQAIYSFETSAKALGLDVSSKVGKYNKGADDLRIK